MQGIKYIPIDLRSYSKYLTTRLHNSQKEIFDPIRKSWIILQPEELVRQLFVQFLLRGKNVPAIRISEEVQIKVNNQLKRYDLAVVNRLGTIDLLLECKAFTKELGLESFLQVGNYNENLNARYIGLTNGHQTIMIENQTENNTFNYMHDFPDL